MKLIYRYISFSVLASTFLVMTLLLALQLLIIVVNELDTLGTGQYHLKEVLRYAAYSLPHGFYHFAPMIGLMGSLLGLGSLAAHHELVVIRAAGFSLQQIMRAVFISALVFMGITLGLGEFLGPYALNKAEMHKATALNNGQSLHTKAGLWMRDQDTFIHVQQVEPGIGLSNVARYEFGPHEELLRVSYAKRATFQKGAWWLQDIVETQLARGKTQTQNIQQELWKVDLNPELINLSKIDLDRMSLISVYRLIQYREQHELDTSLYRLEFWQRLLEPLASIIMIFLAVPFILGPLRTVTMGVRILSGLCIGIAFYLLNRFFGAFSLVYHLSPLWGALFPSLVMLGLGSLLMRLALF